jgi:MFS family permease
VAEAGSPAASSLPGPAHSKPRLLVIACMGIGQILAWGSSYYLLAVLARPVARETGWPSEWIIGALSLGLLISGLGSPRVGYLIERYGGRPVLAASAVLLALGLLVQGLAPNLPMFILAWVFIGLGMSAGLYDPAFSTLGRLYGEHARSAITQLTLFGGFASTVCWPLSAFFVEHVGWRGACLAYAGISIVIILPLYLFGVPLEERRLPPPRTSAAHVARPRRSTEDRYALVLIAAGLTVASVIMTVVSVHILTLMQARGLTLAVAVSFGALIGPSQVGARVLEAAFGRKHHPVWSFLVSSALVAIGLTMLLGPASVIGAGLVLYGSGSGIRSIVRGTVPLALFGREGYAVLMGWLAMPSLIAQAASPSLGSILIEHLGADRTIAVLIAAALVNILLVLPLLPLARRRRVMA